MSWLLPTASEVRRIAGRADVDERSIRRAYRAAPVRPATYGRIVRAARELGVAAPPPRVLTAAERDES